MNAPPEQGTVLAAADILVVEDDDDLRGALAESLRAEGYVVDEASNGHTAMSSLHEAPLPRMILLDLMMPVMNGWEFREAQRRDPVLASIPVVVITGHGDGASVASALEAVDVMAKPIDFDQLLAVVRRVAR